MDWRYPVQMKILANYSSIMQWKKKVELQVCCVMTNRRITSNSRFTTVIIVVFAMGRNALIKVTSQQPWLVLSIRNNHNNLHARMHSERNSVLKDRYNYAWKLFCIFRNMEQLNCFAEQLLLQHILSIIIYFNV